MALDLTNADLSALLAHADAAIFAGQHPDDDAALNKLLAAAVERGVDVSGFEELDSLPSWPHGESRIVRGAREGLAANARAAQAAAAHRSN